MQDVISVLEVERETWNQVCLATGSTSNGGTPAAAANSPASLAGGLCVDA
jgi:hypothetical protein